MHHHSTVIAALLSDEASDIYRQRCMAHKCGESRTCKELEAVQAVFLFSKLVNLFFGDFDPVHIFLDNKNK